MDILLTAKALANETRLNILKWLREPEKNFPPQGAHLPDPSVIRGGVCVGSIADKAGISQSTISNYLELMKRAGLLESERHGKWTYYRRSEKGINELCELIRKEL